MTSSSDSAARRQCRDRGGNGVRGIPVAAILLFATLALNPVVRAQNVVATIYPATVQKSVFAVAINAVTNKAYVVNSGSASVTVIDGQTDATTVVPTGVAPWNAAVNPITNKIYVTNSSDTVVTVIDGATNVASAVTVGAGAESIVVNPVTNKIYVASSTTQAVMVIDGATNATSAINVGSQGIAGIVVNPLTNRVYLADSSDNAVIVIDGATNKVLTSVDTGNFPYQVAVNPVTNTIYATNSGDNTVSVVDGATNTVTATVTVGKSPGSLAVNVATNRIYVANAGDNTVTVIDGATNTPTAVPVGSSPAAIGIDAQRNMVFVANSAALTNSTAVTLIDGSTNAVSSIAVGSHPVAVGVNAVTGKVYVGNNGDGSVSVIDSATYATNKSSPIPTGTDPVAVAINPLTNKAYVANKGSANVTVIDGVTGATATVVTGTSPAAVAANPATDKIYVANGGSSDVTVIDGATNGTTTVAVGTNPAAVAINLVTNKIYVSNTGSDSVTVIDGATQAAASVTVGSKPAGLTVNPVTNKVYVADSGADTVTVIDGATFKVTATVTVGENPVAIDINPNTNSVYVANSASNYVSILNGATDTYATDFSLAGGSIAVAVDAAANHVYAIGNTTSLVDYDAALGAGYTVPVNVTTVALAVNPGSHRVYITGKDYPQVVVMDGASRGLRETDLGAGNVPTALGVNPATGQVFAALSSTNLVETIREQRTTPVPLTAAITPIVGNTTAIPNPTFVISAASTFVPTALPPRAAYVQADSWQGPWTVATPTGNGQFSSSALVLSPGFHTIYAYATDGQDATSVSSGAQSNVFASNVVSYSLLVLQSNSPFGALSSQALTFRSLPVTVASDAQSVTLSNGGGAPLALGGISITGSDVGDFAESDTCPATLTSGASCTISVTFTPTVSGARSAAIVVASNSAGGSQSIELNGSGIDLSLAVATGSPVTQTIQAGQTATYNLQLIAAGAANVTDQVSATIRCSGAPALATCNVPDAAVITTGETPGTFQISVSTTGPQHSASLVPASPVSPSGQAPGATWLGRQDAAGLLSACLSLFGRRERPIRPCARIQGPCARSPSRGMRIGWIRAALCLSMLLVCVSGAVLLTGCGSNNPGNGGTTPPTNPPPPAQATAPGTYTLTVVATVGGLARTTQLTLVVQ